MYISTKTYGHERGLSCAFRQWRADHSHCSFVHGYAIAVTLTFGAKFLDERNWVMDFGGLKQVKAFLEETFDHKTIVAADDPRLMDFEIMAERGTLDLKVLPAVGCEAFAEYIHRWVTDNLLPPVNRVRQKYGFIKLLSVEVREHGANSAIYRPE